MFTVSLLVPIIRSSDMWVGVVSFSLLSALVTMSSPATNAKRKFSDSYDLKEDLGK